MTWTYTFHRFPNRQAFDAAYDAAGFPRIDGEIAPPETVALDVFGVAHGPAEFDVQGRRTKAPVALTGFHVNAAWSSDVPAPFSSSRISPHAPRRVFA
jgi:hypothetical protein